jgi:TolB-like protein/DNA-binding winged helix-turn-helix (wHTH) protein/Flp pilus assembly protein TadD
VKSHSQHPKAYLLGEYRIEIDTQLISREGVRILVPRRPFQVLLYLIEHRDRVVSRAELLDLFWEGKDVYDDSLGKCLGKVRKALADSSTQPRFIETRYAGGYRFIGQIVEVDRAEPLEEAATDVASVAVVSQPATATATVPQTPDAPQIVAPRKQPWTGRGLLAGSTLSGRFLIACSIALTLALTAMIILGRRTASAPGTTAPAVTERSVAVLPLKNLTGDANDEYLSDGLTESLINKLARIDSLKVISSQSSFTLKGQETDAMEVGRRLGVAHILEGSVSRSANQIRINLRLVSTADGRVIWTGDSYNRSLSDIFEVQDEISCNVAAQLSVILCGSQLHKHYTENVPAYQEYLKGRFYWNKRTAEGITKSIAHYEAAIKLDPNYALAYAGIADSYVQGIWHVPFKPEDAVPTAKAAALKALTLDNDLAEGHTALASVYQMEWNWDGAGRGLRKAIEIDPQYARAYHVQAFHFMVTGHHEEAVASIKRACELDPLNLVVNADAGEILFTAGQTAEAFAQWQKTLDLDPNFPLVHEHLYRAHVVQGNEAAAVAEYLQMCELTDKSGQKVNAYRVAAARGLRGIWQKELSDLQAAQARGEYAPAIGQALLQTQLGHKKEAIVSLNTAYKSRESFIVLIVSPMFKPLHSDPAFQDILKLTGLAS